MPHDQKAFFKVVLHQSKQLLLFFYFLKDPVHQIAWTCFEMHAISECATEYQHIKSYALRHVTSPHESEYPYWSYTIIFLMLQCILLPLIPTVYINQNMFWREETILGNEDQRRRCVNIIPMLSFFLSLQNNSVATGESTQGRARSSGLFFGDKDSRNIF